MRTKYPPNPIIAAIEAGQCLTYETIEMGPGWVSDELREEMKTWDCTRLGLKPPVLINAPTGLGKNTFVLNCLAGYAAGQNRYVLLLSNRYTLNSQQKNILSNRAGHPRFGSSTISNVKIFGNVIPLLYHEVPYVLPVLRKYSIGYVVFDEVHFFCSDATFNVETSAIYKQILQSFSRQTRIYMSATPGDVKPLIAYEEFYLYQTFRDSNNSVSRLSSMIGSRNYHITEYLFPRNYSFVNLSFFIEWEEIEKLVKEQSSDEKWLVFVRSKEDGDKLRQKMSGYAEFIDAFYKDIHSDRIQKLARIERFEQKVLIATTVLYNGFSFRDNKLRNIVVDSADRVEILQMLGRKRLHGNETINLYVRQKELSDIIAYKQTCIESYQILDDFIHDPNEFAWNVWGTLTESQQHLFLIDNNNRISVNPHSQYQLSCLMGKYEGLEDSFSLEGSSAFVNEVCSWFDAEYIPEMGETFAEKIKKRVIDFVEKYIDQPMEEAAFSTFREQLLVIVSPLIKEMNQEKKNSIRNDGDHPGADIKNIFKFFSLPYTCKKAKKQWTIFKITDNIKDVDDVDNLDDIDDES